MLLAIATTSITLIPVTAIAYRAQIQTAGASEIIVPVILATICSTVVGIFFTIVFGKTKRWNYQCVIDREIAAGTIQINPDYIGPDPIVLPDDYVPAEEREAEAKKIDQENILKRKRQRKKRKKPKKKKRKQGGKIR
jgi:hypothetical protein